MSIPIYDAIFLGIQCFCYIIYIMLALSFFLKMVKNADKDKDITTFKIHFITNSFFDIMQALSVIFFQKFLHWRFWLPYIIENKWISFLYAPVLYISIFGSVIGGCYTVINRYCALVYPISFRQKWSTKVSYFLITLQFILPIICFLQNTFVEAKVIYVEKLDIYTFTIVSEKISQHNNLILSIGTGIVSFITLSCNVIILHRYTKLMQGLNKNEQSKRTSIFFYSLITTLCLFFLFVEQLVRYFFGLKNNKFGIYILTYVLYWIIPIFTCLQPILILVISKKIRKEFLKVYFSCILPEKCYNDNNNVILIIGTSEKKIYFKTTQI
uniref:G_PROTEIN_RECEP_F1_2 domain-containing protein n=1 Tax=Strongyloides papillosus TaxID=174720 RepID=A0A0N5BDA8_STREA